ncbi:hypothetical protein ACW95P_03140 [Candidatus Mycoplasma pogonae]
MKKIQKFYNLTVYINYLYVIVVSLVLIFYVAFDLSIFRNVVVWISFIECIFILFFLIWNFVYFVFVDTKLVLYLKRNQILNYFKFAKINKAVSVNRTILNLTWYKAEGFVCIKLAILQAISSLIIVVNLIYIFYTNNLLLNRGLWNNNDIIFSWFKSFYFNYTVVVLATPSLLTILYAFSIMLLIHSFIPQKNRKYIDAAYKDYDYFIENLEKNEDPNLIYALKYKKNS